MIKIILGSDDAALDAHATCIASALRRSRSYIHVRLYYRGENPPPSFHREGLFFEVIESKNYLSGSFPYHITGAAYDRLQCIKDADDWDRALILDHDQLVLCDLTPLFSEYDFPEHALLAARPHFDTIKNTARDWFGRTLPKDIEKEIGEFPWFYFGPLLNLRKMRKESYWDSLIRTQQLLEGEEQLSVVCTTAGRVDFIDDRWNIIPLQHWDLPLNIEKLEGNCILHFTGPSKPWNINYSEYTQLWHAEKVTFDQLSNPSFNLI
jgi:lipopolysaccharide biosynthesis glycosyltransferase